MARRDVVEGIQRQGENEEIDYVLDTTNWGGSPSGVTVTATDQSDGSDVSGTVLDGSPSVSGDDITLPTVKSLTDGTTYRIKIKFTSAGQVLEAFFDIIGEE